jgi:O-antigen/teichoic acid export membrane protein
MSRLKHYTRSLVSSYALLGVNALYTLISLPVALKYLTRAEIGLWALTMQIASYVAMVDLGMSSSVARILIDHKDDRANGRYGAALKSGFLAGAAQGLLTLLLGLSVVWFLGGWLRVPPELSRAFFWLILGQVLMTALGFPCRNFGQILYAWQRMDVYNYGQMLQLLAGLLVLWLGFLSGWGVLSFLAGSAAGWFCGTLVNATACFRLGLWPKPGEWGRVTATQFRELFSYGADLFLLTIGGQLITSSQTILVSRQLGMDAAALWSVMTRAFTVVVQITWRVIGNAMPAFSEMYVRNERERLWQRYRTLFVTVSGLAGAGGVLFAACNGPFVGVWTHGRFSWPGLNNALLGAWLIISAQQCCHNSFIACLKQVRLLKYVFVLEGLLFVGVSLAILKSTGLTGMLLCSVTATFLFTWLAGTWRIAGLLGGSWRSVLWDWQVQTLGLLSLLIPIWLLLDRALDGTPDLVQLVVKGTVLSAVGAWTFVRFTLPRPLVAELIQKLPAFAQRPALRLTGLIGHVAEPKAELRA